MTATNPTTPGPAPVLEKDPVCGMNVNPATAKNVHEYGGRKFYFCCAGCAEKFKSDPAGYLNKPAAHKSELVIAGDAGRSQSCEPSVSAGAVAVAAKASGIIFGSAGLRLSDVSESP